MAKKKSGFIDTDDKKGKKKKKTLPVLQCEYCRKKQNTEKLKALVEFAYEAGKKFVAEGMKPLLENIAAEMKGKDAELNQLRQVVPQLAAQLASSNSAENKVVLQLENIFPEKKKFKKQIKYDAEGRIVNISDESL